MMPSSNNQRSYSRFIPSEEVGDFKQWKFSAVDGSDLVEPTPEPVAEIPVEVDEAELQLGDVVRAVDRGVQRRDRQPEVGLALCLRFELMAHEMRPPLRKAPLQAGVGEVGEVQDGHGDVEGLHGLRLSRHHAQRLDGFGVVRHVGGEDRLNHEVTERLPVVG